MNNYCPLACQNFVLRSGLVFFTSFPPSPAGHLALAGI